MTEKIERPEIYHIQHPLSDRNSSDQVLASFSDEDVAEYRSEFEEYRRIQSTAVSEVNDMFQQTRLYFKALFGDDTKQMKYLERCMRNGDFFTDQHAKRYERPDHVEARVQEARKKYCSFLSDENAPKIGGEDTLQEINNATTFLMEKGLVLNTDFTISNAVSLSQSIASEDFDDALNAQSEIPATQFNIMLKDVDVFPADKYSLYSNGRGYLRLRCDEIDYEAEGKLEEMAGNYLSYTTSFKDSSTPSYIVCEARE